jgi:hypothetical protein
MVSIQSHTHLSSAGLLASSKTHMMSTVQHNFTCINIQNRCFTFGCVGVMTRSLHISQTSEISVGVRPQKAVQVRSFSNLHPGCLLSLSLEQGQLLV